jgi:hypothetical protein
MKTIGEMMSINKHNAFAAIKSWTSHDGCQYGYWVTLDAICFGQWTPDRIEFENKLCKFANRLNSYCYGRTYRGRKNRLKIVGSIEFGQHTNRQHAHLLVLHGEDMKRNFFEVEEKIRRYWYRLMDARGSGNGNLVDVQPVGDIDSRLQYALKHYHAQYDKYSRVVIL